MYNIIQEVVPLLDEIITLPFYGKYILVHLTILPPELLMSHKQFILELANMLPHPVTVFMI